jgi:hypothetical protein
VILLTDEDIGTNVPKALSLVGYDARSLVGMGWATRPDTWWLEQVGRLGWLVFSANKRMLRVPSERKVIIDAHVGIVYLTKGEEHLPAVLSLLLRKWDTLEALHETTARPFARFLSPGGDLTDSWRDLKL